MPNTYNILKQSITGFKHYTCIHKVTFNEILSALKDYEARKTKSGRPSATSLEEQLLSVK